MTMKESTTKKQRNEKIGSSDLVHLQEHFKASRWSKFAMRLQSGFHISQWKKNVLGIIWTAGPVTFLGLTVGHYFAYQTFPQKDLFIYFSFYVLVSGVVTFFINFYKASTSGHEMARGKQHFRVVVEKILGLLNSTKTTILFGMKHFERTKREAMIIIENPDASGEDLKKALLMLTTNENLAEYIKSIEIYRHYGLTLRIQDQWEKHKEEAINFIKTTNTLTPLEVQTILDRFQGSQPSKKVGRPRRPGFLGRMLTFMELKNPDLIKLEDVYEVLILVYELLNGRKIPLFDLVIPGAPEITKLSAELENHGRTFRLLLENRGRKIRQLGRILSIF